MHPLTNSKAWITVHGLDNLHSLCSKAKNLSELYVSNTVFCRDIKNDMYLLLYLVKNHPVGVNLSITLWVQYNCLIGSEVCQRDLCIFWTVIDPVDYLVLVKV